MARAHVVAAIVEEDSREEGRRARAAQLTVHGPVAKLRLHRFEQSPVDYRFVLTAIHLATIDDVADIEAVLQDVRERSHHEAPGRGPVVLAVLALPRCDASDGEILNEKPNRAEREIALKDG